MYDIVDEKGTVVACGYPLDTALKPIEVVFGEGKGYKVVRHER